MENDFPCECGHKKEEHANGVEGRYDCQYSISGFYLSCPFLCQKYKPDNLKYLEIKYKEKYK